MNIVIVSTAYPFRGGIAHYVALLYRRLAQRNNVKVVTFTRQYPSFLFPGTTQEETGGSELLRIPAERLVDSVNPFTWMSAAKKIAATKPDVLVFKYWLPFFGPCFGYIARKVKKLTGGHTRTILIADNIIPHERRVFDKVFTNYAMKSADAVIVQSASVERELKHHYPNKPYRMVPHPIYEIFGNAIGKREARDRIKVRDARIMLFFGYIRPYKGLSTLLKAMPEIAKRTRAKLLVVGECYGDEQEYRKQIKDLKLESSVDFRAEYVSPEDVNLYFSAADLIVLPYSSATQSGIVQIAYQFDKPVVATNVGGLAEVVVDGKTGYIVKPNDPKELADAVNRYFEQRKEGDFVRNIHDEKRKYSWDHLTKAIVELGRQPEGGKGGSEKGEGKSGKEEGRRGGRFKGGRGNEGGRWKQRLPHEHEHGGLPRSQTRPHEPKHTPQGPQPPQAQGPRPGAVPPGPGQPRPEGGAKRGRRRGWRGGRGRRGGKPQGPGGGQGE
ncbi:MAG: glycosyltransferase family 4 protein [Bacteroidetes bacterium]|jgi:glycosyltransferase involved in cell wall biosynthesis|nr:glycosyltransferase family 4 protein [Bacteroidota bacterium]